MTPIESKDDVRLSILLAVLTNLAAELALKKDQSPSQIISDALFYATYIGLSQGIDNIIEEIEDDYPMLDYLLT